MAAPVKRKAGPTPLILDDAMVTVLRGAAASEGWNPTFQLRKYETTVHDLAAQGLLKKTVRRSPRLNFFDYVYRITDKGRTELGRVAQ